MSRDISPRASPRITGRSPLPGVASHNGDRVDLIYRDGIYDINVRLLEFSFCFWNLDLIFKLRLIYF